MNLGRALLYFLREASISLVRSWKASAVAVLTIAMSLLVGGFFVLATSNISRRVAEWSTQLRVAAYLTKDSEAAERAELERLMAGPDWVLRVETVSAAEALERFSASFPSLRDVLADTGVEAFAPSLEAVLAPQAAASRDLEGWLSEVRAHSSVAWVDDDREWLARLSAILRLVRSAGLAIGAGLLAAATLTIASVVRLTAYLYVEEIAVMRMVGATEFFIRGPFYVEGCLQGLLGAVFGYAGLQTVAWMMLRNDQSLWLPLIFEGLVTWRSAALLAGVGAAAGLLGAVLSLRRESLRVEGRE